MLVREQHAATGPAYSSVQGHHRCDNGGLAATGRMPGAAVLNRSGKTRQSSRGPPAFGLTSLSRALVMPAPPTRVLTILAARYSAARFGVNSSGNPLCPVNLSPSSYISNARFLSAGRTEAILSRSKSAAIPG